MIARHALTVQLATRCDLVLAADAAARAVALTAAATARLPGVSVRQLDITRQWPQGRFDLLVLSEIGYYAADLDMFADRLTGCLREDGVVVLCHWRHPTLEHLHSAEKVHTRIRRRSGLCLLAGHQEEDFLLDVLCTNDVSVARADAVLD